jgi:hypothetical protein
VETPVAFIVAADINATENPVPLSIGRFEDRNHDAKFPMACFERALPVTGNVLSREICPEQHREDSDPEIEILFRFIIC